jgi:hypothetical protein
MFYIGTLLGASCSDAATKEFYCGQKVRVIAGFYKGCTGVVIGSEPPLTKGILYDLQDVRCRTINVDNIVENENNLKLIEK